MSKPTAVCGVANIETASDECLIRLLDTIGRHDPVGAAERIEAINVRKVLALRKKNGVTIAADGNLHHRV